MSSKGQDKRCYVQVKHAHKEKMVQADILKLLSICVKVLIMHTISVYRLWVPQTQSKGASHQHALGRGTRPLPVQLTGAF